MDISVWAEGTLILPTMDMVRYQARSEGPGKIQEIYRTCNTPGGVLSEDRPNWDSVGFVSRKLLTMHMASVYRTRGRRTACSWKPS